MLQFNMDQANAEEFLEVYKGVVAEYTVSMGTIFCTLNCCLTIVTIQNPVTRVNLC